MPTTPGVSIHLYIGGQRKVMTGRPKWVEHNLEEIAYPGRERQDKVVFIPKCGWRLLDYRTVGYLGFETGKDKTQTSALYSRASFGAYQDTSLAIYDSTNPRYRQRWVQELGVPQGSQTTQGDEYIRKHARQVTGLASDWGAFPPPPVDEPVALDRCTVSGDSYGPNDSFRFGWSIQGSPARTLGPVFRFYFPGVPGQTQSDGNLSGVGSYACTLLADGTALLHELRSDSSWALRASFSWCESSRVLSTVHRIVVESDAVRDGNGNVFGKHIRIGFSSQTDTGAYPTLTDLDISLTNSTGKKFLDAGYDYLIPNPKRQLYSATQAKIRIDARRDCQLDFSFQPTTFFDSGTLYCKTIALDGPTSDGKVHVQVFGHFPQGTGANIRLFGNKSGTECNATNVTPSGAQNRTRGFIDFDAIPGETSYVLRIDLSASSDGLKSPTIQRVRYIREAQFTTVVDVEKEVTNLVSVSTTGAGADPSTETLGFVCYAATEGENATLALRSGQRVRLEADLGPKPGGASGERLISVLFRGQIVEARRRKLSGKRNKGFGENVPQSGESSAGLSRFVCKAASEWTLLSKRLAPGRLDFSYAGDGADSSQIKAFRITDAIRYLLYAVLPPERVDVPDLDIPLPIEAGSPTYIEKYQPCLALAMTLVRDYLGGYAVMDWNASPPSGDPRGQTSEGMLRVLISPKSPYKPVVEFCKGVPPEVTANVVVTDPAAYPDVAASGNVPAHGRTFLRQGSGDSWIEPPSVNQIQVRGVGRLPTGSLALGTVAAMVVRRSNYKAATFPRYLQDDGTLSPAQGSSGGPPAVDPTSIDYKTGDIETLDYSDPMLNTAEACRWVANRLYDLRCHGKRWEAGEAPVVFVRPTTTGDPMQVRPRTLRYGDIGTVRDDDELTNGVYVVSESPSILADGRLGGSGFLHGYYALYSAPTTNSWRAAYGDNGS